MPVKLGYIAGITARNVIERGEAGEVSDGKKSTMQHLRPHVRTRTFFRNGKTFSGSTGYYDEQNSQLQLQLFEQNS